MKQFIICIALLCFAETAVHSQTKIERSESSLKQSSERSQSDSDDDNDSDDWFGFFGEAFIFFYDVLFEFPSEVEGRASQASITKYPYYRSKKGNYNYELDDNQSVFRTELVGRYVSENNDLKSMDLNVDLRFAKRMGLELGYRQLWEKNTEFGNDHLALYSILLNYHRVRTEPFDLWWGIGTSYIDGTVNQFGFTYGIGAELFFAKPLSLGVNFNQTFINSETINKFDILFNYHINRYKATGGVDQLKIGTQKFTSLTLGVGVVF